jgi:valyl-tRNA synthetase
MNKERIMEKTKLPERYNFASQEPYWQRFWEEKKIFRFNPEAPGSLYTIDTPPPTISGKLHLGHAFSYIQTEVIAAYRRMAGFNVRYPFGLDNNGLPTERLVEKEEKIDPFQTRMKEFTRNCHEVITRFTPIYKDFFRKLGFRWDLELEYSTISPEVQKLSQSVFIKLFERGLIYREETPALYCPECRTSVAQAEVEDKEKPAVFYDLVFKKPDGSELIIATTRPELLPACVAVFVHPDDKRYKDLVETEVETPLGTKIKVFADDKVSVEKGTGAVMCCTYGDVTDVYWQREYDLSEKIILDSKGRFTSAAGVPEIEGKSIEEGRKILVGRLRKEGLLQGEKRIRHEVGVHERCGTPIEIISIPQWFVKILEMKPKLLAAAEQINWYPHYMKKRYLNWVKGLKWDWCISRERFFGIPIPAFYCQDCQGVILPKVEELPIDPRVDKKERSCPHCQSKNIKEETAVLDTWFTSSLTPEINNRHPLNDSLVGKMYPMSMRPHGHDIIRSWTTYSILMGLLLHEGVSPWRDIMVSGHILAKKGEKISKRTGGGSYDPLELVEKYSADALRYVMCGGALGKDVYFDEGELKKGQKLVVKIYNAGRFTLSNLQDFDPQIEIADDSLEAIDRWILFKAQETAVRMSYEFKRYEFGKSRQIFEEFFWRDFCDNYLEIIKGRIYGENEKLRRSAQYALYHTYLNILKMVAPFLPHISEKMYHSYCESSSRGLRLGSATDKGYFFQHEGIPSIHLASWPILSSREPQIDDKISKGAEITLSILGEIRKARSEVKKRLKEPFTQVLVVCDFEKQGFLNPFLGDIQNFARVEQIGLVEKPPSKLSSEVLLVSL